MRRILMGILVSLLLLSLSVPSFAGTITTMPGTESSQVKITVSSSKTVRYKVDINWDSMDFTYNFGELTWNVNTHQYEALNPTGWNRTQSNVTVINHSNAAVNVTPSLANGTNVAGVTASLNKTAKFALASAEGGSAQSATVTLTVGGQPTSYTPVSGIAFKTLNIVISAS